MKKLIKSLIPNSFRKEKLTSLKHGKLEGRKVQEITGELSIQLERIHHQLKKPYNSSLIDRLSLPEALNLEQYRQRLDLAERILRHRSNPLQRDLVNEGYASALLDPCGGSVICSKLLDDDLLGSYAHIVDQEGHLMLREDPSCIDPLKNESLYSDCFVVPQKIDSYDEQLIKLLLGALKKLRSDRAIDPMIDGLALREGLSLVERGVGESSLQFSFGIERLLIQKELENILHKAIKALPKHLTTRVAGMKRGLSEKLDYEHQEDATREWANKLIDSLGYDKANPIYRPQMFREEVFSILNDTRRHSDDLLFVSREAAVRELIRVLERQNLYAVAVLLIEVLLKIDFEHLTKEDQKKGLQIKTHAIDPTSCAVMREESYLEIDLDLLNEALRREGIVEAYPRELLISAIGETAALRLALYLDFSHDDELQAFDLVEKNRGKDRSAGSTLETGSTATQESS